MHTLDLQDIGGIVEEYLNKANPQIKFHGEKLLEQWNASLNGERKDFCENHIIPVIDSLRKKQRKEARRLLFAIKMAIADAAVTKATHAEELRQSARKVAQEMLECYRIIEKVGRGVVYLGSARTRPGEEEYELARELGAEIENLLHIPAWSGAGPGAMEAPLRGAKEAGGMVGGIKIILSHEQTMFEQKINAALDDTDVAQCDKFAPRKIGLVDAGMGPDGLFVAFPGGFGTFDELFEILVLKQLHKLSNDKVDIVLMNYDGAYDKFMELVEDTLKRKKISPDDIYLFKIFSKNREALDYLADKRKVPYEKRTYIKKTLRNENPSAPVANDAT